MIETRMRVVRYSREWDTWQELVKEWRLVVRSVSIRIWSTVVDREEVPRHVYIGYLAFGDWDGWKSKFINHIRPNGHISKLIDRHEPEESSNHRR
jgi:hypothetical protein